MAYARLLDNESERAYNKRMLYIRITVEWSYGEGKKHFKIQDLSIEAPTAQGSSWNSLHLLGSTVEFKDMHSAWRSCTKQVWVHATVVGEVLQCRGVGEKRNERRDSRSPWRGRIFVHLKRFSAVKLFLYNKRGQREILIFPKQASQT